MTSQDPLANDLGGIIRDSIGSIGANVINIGSNLVIQNTTNKEIAALKKIQDIPSPTEAVDEDTVTKENINVLQQQIEYEKNLLERNHIKTHTINEEYKYCAKAQYFTALLWQIGVLLKQRNWVSHLNPVAGRVT
jgi:hypothetical protein